MRLNRQIKGGSFFSRSTRVEPKRTSRRSRRSTQGPIDNMTSKWIHEYILIHHNCRENNTHRKDILLCKLVVNGVIYYHHIPTNEVYIIDNFIDGEQIIINDDDWSAVVSGQGNFKNVRPEEIMKYIKLEAPSKITSCLKLTICCYLIRPYGKFIKKAYRNNVIKKF